jgi:hypothetical protein
VLDPLLLKYAEEGDDVPVSDQHVSLQKYETAKELAMILDLLVEDILENETFLLVRFLNAYSRS